METIAADQSLKDQQTPFPVRQQADVLTSRPRLEPWKAQQMLRIITHLEQEKAVKAP